jgi:PIN domain nuclease of toxin-antitoxin system
LRVLLDTHVLLRSLEAPERIGGDARRVFADRATAIVVSVVSIWEIAIKKRRGQLSAPDDLPGILSGLGHEVLEVRTEHAWHVAGLPLHHRDPFDRLLVAQAQVENLPLITHDRQLGRYDVKIIRT